jgi:putative transposase
MGESYRNIYLHFVWTTWRREPMIDQVVREVIYRCMEREARKLDCLVLALDGMEDHVHLLIALPNSLAPSKIMQQVKGVSSDVVNSKKLSPHVFRWQDGYGVFSISPPHFEKVVRYVKYQREHHRANRLNPLLENTGDPPMAAICVTEGQLAQSVLLPGHL